MRAVLRCTLQLALIASALALGGCGGVYYTVNVNSAAARVEQARALGAETSAPFEYYYAREHLRQAQVEAAEASYSDAAAYAQIAEEYAQRAIDSVEVSRRGAAK